jgi:hypothetical protein
MASEYTLGNENRFGDGAMQKCDTCGNPPCRQQAGTALCVSQQDYCPNAQKWYNIGDNGPNKNSLKCNPDAFEIGVACCDGYQHTQNPMSSFEQTLSNGKKTACWSGNQGVPSSDYMKGLCTSLDNKGNPKECLCVDNLPPREEHVAGGVLEVAWVATANHGGTVEVALVCDEGNGIDESYANFARNRMTHVGGKMYGSGGKEKKYDSSTMSDHFAWVHSDYTTFVEEKIERNNFSVAERNAKKKFLIFRVTFR